MFRFFSRTVSAVPLLALGPILSAQGAPTRTDTIYFDSNIGSFKFLNSQGTLNFSFEGTVLISGYDGVVTATGALKKEYESKDKKRISYFGKGTLTLKGKWRGVQWFGRNMKGSFEGAGIMRMVGEFDRNMNTGHYWYKSAPEKQIWYATGIERTIPLAEGAIPKKPVRAGGG